MIHQHFAYKTLVIGHEIQMTGYDEIVGFFNMHALNAQINRLNLKFKYTSIYIFLNGLITELMIPNCRK